MLVLRRLSRPPRLAGRLAIATTLAMVVIAYAYASRRADSPARRLADALLAERFTTGRLTGQTAWQPCVPVDTAALVPRVRCGPPLDPRGRQFRRIRTLAHAALQAPDSSASGLRDGAVAELRFADTSTAGRTRAVEMLERAHRLAPEDAGVLNELAIAHLAVGERTQRLAPMLRALDAIERAVARDSARPEILFNRALILQRLYLIQGSGRAWARYLAVERDPAWRAEALFHARRVAQVPDTVSWEALLASPPVRMDAAARAAIAARVRRSPQKAREFGIPLLGAWGTAVQAGDSARAARLLGVAREIGNAAHALGVDESVRLAADAIGAAEGDGTQALARGHAGLAAGRAAYARGAYDKAVRALAPAERALRDGGSPAARWAAFYRAAAAINRVDYAGADSLLGRLLAEAGPREPALRGKLLWAMGLSRLRRGSLEEANRLYREAAALIARTGEAESRGGIAVLLAEGLTMAGQTGAARAEGYQALRALSPYPRSVILANHLAIVSAYAREERLDHAALAITDEMVAVARTLDSPGVLALALCARVRDLIALDRHAAARETLDEASAWSARIAADRGGARIRAQVAFTLGQVTRVRDPRAALPLLERSVEQYSGYGSDLYLPSALYEAALAARAAGDTRRARGWLQRAIAFIEGQRAAFPTAGAGSSFAETVENVFDEMIDLELSEGRPSAALRILERGRIHGGARTPPVAGEASLQAMAATLPADMLFVEYALLRDRLVVWTISRRGTRQHAVLVPRDSVAALAGAVAAGGPGAEAASGRLFDLLLRPLAPQMDGIRQLTIVPDRELFRVPFAALRDRATGRYAVEDYLVRTVPGAAFYRTAVARARPARAGGGALVVGNPRLDTASAGTLGTLPGAGREAQAVAALYPGVTLLTGPAARRARVVDLLPSHAIFHFAGHAVFNPGQPELSYLAMASDAPDGGGMLHGWEIAELGLSTMQVVVLSACSSLSPRPSRTGAAAGLAYSFLLAGAPATVSTLWEVDDGATTGLLVGFHHHMAAGTPPAEALRLAQLLALRSRDPQSTNLRIWAAFIYTGP